MAGSRVAILCVTNVLRSTTLWAVVPFSIYNIAHWWVMFKGN
nr:MAG TPA: hypothetical protein [Caudoviricetes sp.]